MTVMTKGLRAFAGSSLHTVLSKAAVAPLSGAFWGAFMTLLGQSSSATTMTTIGLVSAGLLTFPQGLGLAFSSRVGPGLRRKRRHPGTGWLVALVGVRVPLSSCAPPSSVPRRYNARPQSRVKSPLSRQTSAAQARSKHGAARQDRPKPTRRSLRPQPSPLEEEAANALGCY
jgi:hypothetical protein